MRATNNDDISFNNRIHRESTSSTTVELGGRVKCHVSSFPQGLLSEMSLEVTTVGSIPPVGFKICT